MAILRGAVLLIPKNILPAEATGPGLLVVPLYGAIIQLPESTNEPKQELTVRTKLGFSM